VVPGPWLGELAHHFFALLMVALDWLAAAPGAVWRQHAPPLWSAALALVGVAWMLAPRGVPARFAAPLLLAPMFALRPSGPVLGEAWVTVLDVGQGLAVTVRTANHALQYDAGPSWGADVDAGNRVVVPYLRGEGLARLDALVISHQDSDHSGGAASVMHALPTTTLWSSLDASDPIQSHAPIRLPCRAGVRWQWDGVSFQLLHPAVESYDDPRLKSNWRSCVLRIATARHAVLLTGDIEARDERRLLASSDGLRASVLLAPHHGSGTSSTAAFIDAVKPAHAVFAVGYRNRFGHPKREVLARYEEAGANVWRTDRDGAVTMQLTPDGVTATRYREAAPRYWR
jgi:competence protein ComEC